MNELREFLVSVGYGVRGEKEWQASLAAVDKAAKEIAVAFSAAAAAVTALVVKTADAYSQLEFAAGRANTSAANLQALTYALKQVGFSSDAAGSAVAGLATALRTNPAGAESLIRSLGVQTRVNGKLRDTTDLLLDVIDALGAQDYIYASSVAGALGISEADYNQLRRRAGDIRKFRDEALALAKSLGVSNAGQGATLFMASYRLLTAQFSLVVDAFTVAVAPVLGPLIDDLDAWIQRHSPQIVAFSGMLVEACAGLARDMGRVIAALSPLWDAFRSWIKEATGKDGLVGAIEAIGGAYLVSVVLRLGGPAGAVAAAILALAGLILSSSAQAQPVEANKAPTGIWARVKSRYQRLRDRSGGAYREGGGGGGQSSDGPKGNHGGGRAGAQSREVPNAGEGKASVRYNNPGAQYPSPVSKDYGSTTHAIIGGGHKIAIFEDKTHGAAAQFALLRRGYSGMRLGDLIHRWSGANSHREYTAFMAKALGISPDTVITREMMEDREFMKKWFRAQTQWEAGGKYPITEEELDKAFDLYMETEKAREQKRSAVEQQNFSVADRFAADPLTASPDETFDGRIVQVTQIDVDGDDSPSETARSIARAQSRTNDAMIGTARSQFA
ncbi:hypothetical protein [Azorhizobium caulinodans]|uniref:hypothetical protein n=1 Tax=Azorhizobium caulinodans TaxID=7 RepID=UPI002FBDCDB8